MSRSVGAWNGSFDSGRRRTDVGSPPSFVTARAALTPLTFFALLSSDNIRYTLRTMQRKPQASNKVRLRRARTDIREALLESALVEFGAKGFDGASTRAIARRVEAHQPQINYHLESKAALWTAAVAYLFGLAGEALHAVLPAKMTGVNVSQLAAAFADGIRRFVVFA